MTLDNAVYRRQSQTGTLPNGLGCEKWIKYLGPEILWDSRPGIAESDDPIVPISVNLGAQYSALAHRVNTVLNQVDKNLSDHTGITVENGFCWQTFL